MKKNRGSAGIDSVTITMFELRKPYYLDLLHRKLRDGTYRPHPVKRVEIEKSDGGVRELGVPMGYAYCISLLRRLGIAVAAPTSMNLIYQLTQYSGRAVADQVDSYQTSH